VKNKVAPAQKMVTLPITEISRIKREAADAAAEKAFELMLAIPVMVLRDKYGQLNKLEINGKSRGERFADYCLDLYDSFNKGLVSIEDLHECLWEEAGIKLQKR
jgi:hypothetical protein